MATGTDADGALGMLAPWAGRDHTERRPHREEYATSVTALLVRHARALSAPGRGGAGPGQPVSQLRGPGLSPGDNQLLFESVARLNAAKPSQTGRSEAWSNPQTNSSGSSTLLRVFHSGGMACHLVRHHIVVAGRQPGHDYRLTSCRTQSGEWKTKG
jgi:surface antigen